jgi:hypothetical protein
MREAMHEIEGQAAIADRAAASTAADGARMTAVESDVADMKAQIASMTGAFNELLRRLPASADAPAAAAMPNVEPSTIFDGAELDSEELEEVAADDCPQQQMQQMQYLPQMYQRSLESNLSVMCGLAAVGGSRRWSAQVTAQRTLCDAPCPWQGRCGRWSSCVPEKVCDAAALPPQLGGGQARKAVGQACSRHSPLGW